MGRFSSSALAGLLFGFGLCQSAHAQGLGEAMRNALQQQTDLIRQQTDQRRMRAEPEKPRMEPETGNPANSAVASLPQPSSSRYRVGLGDSLAHMKVATYRLKNGVILKVSGIYHPPQSAICLAYCPPADATIPGAVAAMH